MMLEAYREWVGTREPAMAMPRFVRLLAISGVMGGGITVALMGVQHLAALPIFITSWTSSSALILSAPKARAAHPAVVVTAHLICGAIGIGAAALITHVPTAIVVSVVLSLFSMFSLRVMHPPAAANPVIALTTIAPHGPLMLGWIGGSVCLAAFALLMSMLSMEANCHVEPPDPARC